MATQNNSTKNLSAIRFRALINGESFIGEANILITKGSGITDEYGYTDDDEVKVDLDTVFSEDDGCEVFPCAPGNYPLRCELERAALDEYYNPTSSMKIFPGEEGSHWDSMVSLGKLEDLELGIAA